MKEACRISAGALKVAGEAVEPGVTTAEIDKLAYDYIKSQGAEPNFLGYGGFPGTACISINDEIIHGIPGQDVYKRQGHKLRNDSEVGRRVQRAAHDAGRSVFKVRRRRYGKDIYED